MLVCLDTPLFIYMQQSEPLAGHEDLFKGVRAYEKWLRETEWGVLIPTPVVSGFLCSRDAQARQSVLTALQGFADIAELDLRAAELAARLRYTYAERDGLPADPRKQTLTVDMMIAAIAIANQASYIITHDVDDFETITAEFDIDVRDIIDGPPGQGKLI